MACHPSAQSRSRIGRQKRQRASTSRGICDRPAQRAGHCGRPNPHRPDPAPVTRWLVPRPVQTGRQPLDEGAARATSPLCRTVTPLHHVARAAHPPPYRRPRPDGQPRVCTVTAWPGGPSRPAPASAPRQPVQRGTRADPGRARGQARSRIMGVPTLRPSAPAKSPFTSALPDVHPARHRGEVGRSCPGGHTPAGRSCRGRGVERTTCFVRGLACSLVVLGQAMFWCVATFQDSRPIPRSLVRRTGAPARRIRLPAGGVGGAGPDYPGANLQVPAATGRPASPPDGTRRDDDQGRGDVGSGCRSHRTTGSNLGCAAPNGDPESGSSSGCPPRTGWR